jgi:hypothetical protein
MEIAFKRVEVNVKWVKDGKYSVKKEREGVLDVVNVDVDVDVDDDDDDVDDVDDVDDKDEGKDEDDDFGGVCWKIFRP